MSTLLRLYSSADAGGAGLITGQANTLVAILRAILVNGYAGFPAAGWTEPIAAAGNCAAFKQGGGAGFHLFVNDNGPNVTSTTAEAWITGWETLAGIAAPVGSGTGQFPLPAQLLTTGHCVVRKSAAANGTQRDWWAFADSQTLYMGINTGDVANTYFMWGFGNGFSIKSTADAYCCFIAGRNTENSASGSFEPFGSGAVANAAITGMFLARTYSGAGSSITMGHHGDYSKSGSQTYIGVIQYANGPNNGLYLCPLVLHEPGGPLVRGRLRGLYHICHPLASFADNATFPGAGDFAGKTFLVKKQIFGTAGAAAFLAIESSATVESN